MQYKKENNAPDEKKKVEEEAFPVRATTSWQIEKRSSERKHVPPKRYGIDLVLKYPKYSQKKEEKAPEEFVMNPK